MRLARVGRWLTVVAAVLQPLGSSVRVSGGDEAGTDAVVQVQTQDGVKLPSFSPIPGCRLYFDGCHTCLFDNDGGRISCGSTDCSSYLRPRCLDGKLSGDAAPPSALQEQSEVTFGGMSESKIKRMQATSPIPGCQMYFDGCDTCLYRSDGFSSCSQNHCEKLLPKRCLDAKIPPEASGIFHRDASLLMTPRDTSNTRPKGVKRGNEDSLTDRALEFSDAIMRNADRAVEYGQTLADGFNVPSLAQPTDVRRSAISLGQTLAEEEGDIEGDKFIRLLARNAAQVGNVFSDADKAAADDALGASINAQPGADLAESIKDISELLGDLSSAIRVGDQ